MQVFRVNALGSCQVEVKSQLVEESDGRDYSVVRRPIEIVSN